MSPTPSDEPSLPARSRWLVVGGVSLLALPVVFSFFFFGLVAADGAAVGGVATEQVPRRPLLATALAAGAAVMAGGWAGLVPWAMDRGELILPTFVTAVALVGVLFGMFVLVA